VTLQNSVDAEEIALRGLPGAIVLPASSTSPRCARRGKEIRQTGDFFKIVFGAHGAPRRGTQADRRCVPHGRRQATLADDMPVRLDGFLFITRRSPPSPPRNAASSALRADARRWRAPRRDAQGEAVARVRHPAAAVVDDPSPSSRRCRRRDVVDARGPPRRPPLRGSSS
jgi:hypothetical protein